MLVLSRRCGEEIVIGENIRLTVVSVQNGQVRIGITAPRSVTVDRQEVHDRRIQPEMKIDLLARQDELREILMSEK